MLLVSLNCLFSFTGSLLKWLAYSLLRRSNGEIIRNKQFFYSKKAGIFNIIDHIKVLRVAVVNRTLSSLHRGSITIISYRFFVYKKFIAVFSNMYLRNPSRNYAVHFYIERSLWSCCVGYRKRAGSTLHWVVWITDYTDCLSPFTGWATKA